MEETLGVLAFMSSIIVVVIGLTADYWIWWLPSAKLLQRRADESSVVTTRLEAFNGTTLQFVEANVPLHNRIRILDSQEMIEDRVADMKSHFVVFVFAQVMLVFVAIVRASEGLGKHTQAPSSSSNVDPEQAGLRATLRFITRHFLESWYAPIIETAFFFMVAYAIFLLLRDVKKLNRARIT
jgi:hypothetical protein